MKWQQNLQSYFLKEAWQVKLEVVHLALITSKKKSSTVSLMIYKCVNMFELKSLFVRVRLSVHAEKLLEQYKNKTGKSEYA